MARSRNIKPGFFLNDTLGAMPMAARLLFAGLWTICDRDGKCEDRPMRIKAAVLPYDQCNPEELLSMLADGGFIDRYEVDGVKVIKVLAWEKHQNPHVKEQPSTLPNKVRAQVKEQPKQDEAPDKHGASTVQEPDEQLPKPELAGLIPDSLLLIPDSGFLIPDSLVSHPSGALPGHVPRKRGPKPESAEVWASYSKAYEARYGVPPVRNASVNAQLARVVGKLGAEEAPHVAAWYVSSQSGLYVAAMHSTALLLRDAEKLRTEWATGRQMTSTQAIQADRTQTNANAFAGLIAAAEREIENAKS